MMITETHIDQIKKRFPKTYARFVDDGCNDTWNLLREWLEYKGQKSSYYAIAMAKMESQL